MDINRCLCLHVYTYVDPLSQNRTQTTLALLGNKKYSHLGVSGVSSGQVVGDLLQAHVPADDLHGGAAAFVRTTVSVSCGDRSHQGGDDQHPRGPQHLPRHPLALMLLFFTVCATFLFSIRHLIIPPPFLQDK